MRKRFINLIILKPVSLKLTGYFFGQEVTNPYKIILFEYDVL